MLKIYGGPTFNAFKVIFTAEESGMEFEYLPVNLAEGEHKTPEHLERHVLGKIPAIVHEGKSLFESAAICRYLAQVSNSDLYDGDVYQKAVIDQWLDLMSNHVGRWLGAHFFQEFVRPQFFQQAADAALLEEAQGFLKDQLPAVDKQLEKYPYLAGSKFSIADIFAFSYFQTHENTSVELDAYPNISRWYDEIKQRPAVAKSNAIMAS